jgi:hypothetical protein
MTKYIIEPLKYSVNGYTHLVRRAESAENGRKTERLYFRSLVAAETYKRRKEKEGDST